MAPERRSTPGRNLRRAFSVLELLIVLAVIVGMMAIAWPRLSRPLADQQLQQAAALIRECIGDARSDSALTGRPTIIRFQPLLSTIVVGSWELLSPENGFDQTSSQQVASQQNRESRRQLGSRLTSAEIGEARTRIVELPTPIIVESLQQPFESQRESTSLVAIFPDGHSRDFTVVLIDPSTQRRLSISYRASTGITEILKISRVRPTDRELDRESHSSRIENRAN